MTDGGDNNSRISRAKVVEELELIGRGIRVFIFLVAQKAPLTEEGRMGGQYMYGFAQSTGGAVIRMTFANVAERDQLDNLAPQIVAQVEGVYRLELGISAVKKTSRVKIVFIDSDRKHSTRNPVYSQQIAPCPSEP